MEYNYFGTDTKEIGHYLRKITETGIDYNRSIELSKLPFYPYDYPEYQNGKRQAPKGYSGLYHKGGYSIFAISGSCIDTRGGCHSVFFFKVEVSEHIEMDLCDIHPQDRENVSYTIEVVIMTQDEFDSLPEYEGQHSRKTKTATSRQ